MVFKLHRFPLKFSRSDDDSLSTRSDNCLLPLSFPPLSRSLELWRTNSGFTIPETGLWSGACSIGFRLPFTLEVYFFQRNPCGGNPRIFMSCALSEVQSNVKIWREFHSSHCLPNSFGSGSLSCQWEGFTWVVASVAIYCPQRGRVWSSMDFRWQH